MRDVGLLGGGASDTTPRRRACACVTLRETGGPMSARQGAEHDNAGIASSDECHGYWSCPNSSHRSRSVSGTKTYSPALRGNRLLPAHGIGLVRCVGGAALMVTVAFCLGEHRFRSPTGRPVDRSGARQGRCQLAHRGVHLSRVVLRLWPVTSAAGDESAPALVTLLLGAGE